MFIGWSAKKRKTFGIIGHGEECSSAGTWINSTDANIRGIQKDILSSQFGCSIAHGVHIIGRRLFSTLLKNTHLKRCIVCQLCHWIESMLLAEDFLGARTIDIVTQTGRERVEWRVELKTTWMPRSHWYCVILYLNRCLFHSAFSFHQTEKPSTFRVHCWPVCGSAANSAYFFSWWIA